MSAQYPVAELDARNVATGDSGNSNYPVAELAFRDVATSSDGTGTPRVVPVLGAGGSGGGGGGGGGGAIPAVDATTSLGGGYWGNVGSGNGHDVTTAAVYGGTETFTILEAVTKGTLTGTVRARMSTDSSGFTPWNVPQEVGVVCVDGTVLTPVDTGVTGSGVGEYELAVPFDATGHGGADHLTINGEQQAFIYYFGATTHLQPGDVAPVTGRTDTPANPGASGSHFRQDIANELIQPFTLSQAMSLQTVTYWGPATGQGVEVVEFDAGTLTITQVLASGTDASQVGADGSFARCQIALVADLAAGTQYALHFFQPSSSNTLMVAADTALPSYPVIASILPMEYANSGAGNHTGPFSALGGYSVPFQLSE